MTSSNHAYLILAHTNPCQLRTLLSMLDDTRNEIYIHLDRSAQFGYETLEGACRLSRLHFITPRRKVTWGGVSIVNVEMALLEEAVKTPHDYYHIISGMDLPIKSQNVIHSFFEANRGKEFLNLWAVPAHTLRRVRYYTLFPEGNHFFLTNWLNHGFKAILQLFRIRMNRDVQFRQGSQWMSITHALACHIVSKKEWVHKVFAHTCICDEIFIPTIVEQSDFKYNLYCNDVTQDHSLNESNMRYIDWSRGESIRHPWTLRTDDFETLMSVPHLWARKFDERIDREIIDKVASAVGKTELEVENASQAAVNP